MKKKKAINHWVYFEKTNTCLFLFLIMHYSIQNRIAASLFLLHSSNWRPVLVSLNGI